MPEILIGRRYQHKKKKTIYRVMHLTNLDADQDNEEFKVQVVYVSEDLKLWSRSIIVFKDRYTLLPE